jgi:hypothetical protein
VKSVGGEVDDYLDPCEHCPAVFEMSDVLAVEPHPWSEPHVHRAELDRPNGDTIPNCHALRC